MGLGYWLTEDVRYDSSTGRVLTDGTWEYKPPASADIPITMNTKLLRDAPNPTGILRSKVPVPVSRVAPRHP